MPTLCLLYTFLSYLDSATPSSNENRREFGELVNEHIDRKSYDKHFPWKWGFIFHLKQSTRRALKLSESRSELVCLYLEREGEELLQRVTGLLRLGIMRREGDTDGFREWCGRSNLKCPICPTKWKDCRCESKELPPTVTRSEAIAYFHKKIHKQDVRLRQGLIHKDGQVNRESGFRKALHRIPKIVSYAASIGRPQVPEIRPLQSVSYRASYLERLLNRAQATIIHYPKSDHGGFLDQSSECNQVPWVVHGQLRNLEHPSDASSGKLEPGAMGSKIFTVLGAC
ncbi:hypothetical protein F5Y18DRAFT_428926 [Xylariaceae sp. FL1019]|nr:hypothetical protein F5Y18DRAFT_428926 [Xylariaceae sp. FL1019]